MRSLALQRQNSQDYNRENILYAVMRDGAALRFVGLELQADQEIVLAAVTQNGLALQWASEELQGDPKVVLEALRSAKKQGAKKFSSVLEYISNSTGAATLRNQNQELFLFLIQNLFLDSQLLLEEEKALIDLHINNFVANSIFRNQKATILEAVQQDGLALRFASDELRGDREVVLTAVQQDGGALEFASDELRGDRKLVLAAVQKDGGALEWASRELQEDRELVLAAVQKDGGALEYASDELKADRELVLEAVKQDGGALEWASRELQGDREVVLAAVLQNGRALQWASRELKRAPDLEVIALCERYKRSTYDPERKGFEDHIIRLVIEKLDTRDEDGRPVNIISCITPEIRRKNIEKIIPHMIRNYEQQEDLNAVLGLTIFGMGGACDAEILKQINNHLLLEPNPPQRLTIEELARWRKFKDNYGKPSPSVASSSTDGAQRQR